MAVFTNKFQVYAYGDLVRIIFEDAVTGNEGVIQAQVIMRTSDAEQLCTAMTDAIKKSKKPPT